MKYKPDAIRFIDGSEGKYLDSVTDRGFEKYAVAVACAGRHSIMLCNAAGTAPGTGLLRGMKALLPPLLPSEAKKTNRIYSEAGEPLPADGARPFRMLSSRMTLADVFGGELFGGEWGCRPGEATLAHNGVLFLDEMQDYRTSVLEMIGIQAVDRKITLVRGEHCVALPADYQIAAACQPCPCGNFGREDAVCLCSLNAIRGYWRRFLPMLDMIEIRADGRENEGFPDMRLKDLRTKVRRAWSAQLSRQGRLNSRLPQLALADACLRLKTTRKQTEALHRMDRRGVNSVTSLAMTVADMEGRPEPREEDVEMALRLHGGLDTVLRTAGIKEGK